MKLKEQKKYRQIIQNYLEKEKINDDLIKNIFINEGNNCIEARLMYKFTNYDYEFNIIINIEFMDSTNIPFIEKPNIIPFLNYQCQLYDFTKENYLKILNQTIESKLIDIKYSIDKLMFRIRTDEQIPGIW